MASRKKPSVAYFCMEFGLHSSLHTYSGGLGILAGDILKAAKDEDLPMVGVGILWRQGYVRQVFGEDGKLYDTYTEYNYDFLKSIKKRVSVTIRGRRVELRIWKCSRFKNAPLYLLDAYLPNNPDKHLTDHLYGGSDEDRVAQEIILGVGGVRALQALSLEPEVFHFNDSHPVLAGVELIRQTMERDDIGFEDAWQKVRNRIVFTTHTPVPAGNEQHDHELLRYMGAYNGLTYNQMLKLGGDPFGMTVAGLRLSRKANAVAKLHGKTARDMWKDVEGASKIVSITNGVHNNSWQDKRIVKAYQDRGDLWEAHQQAKRDLLKYLFERNGAELDEEVLLIGFARRATGYKRGDFILRDRKVIEPLLKKGKLQLVFSGKAHPHDAEGKAAVERLYRAAKRYPNQVVFLENYDMKAGELLTSGCDVWLNNPIRPKEASGTSGMKAAMNGVLNLSVLDGWWPEGCRHGRTGWQFGDGYEGPDADKVDLPALYQVLQREVMPTYYKNHGKWVRMMKASIKMSQEKFSAARMVQDYYEKLYR